MQLKFVWLIVLLFHVGFLFCQVPTNKLAAGGIYFETGLTWRGILSKAANEHKRIFVDCYTTWCGPCKAMDKDVYSNDTVGAYFNSMFLSVKIQMDSTLTDSEQVKEWYSVAHMIQRDYTIMAFPTFLFFAADGRILHRDMAYKSVNKFLVLGQDALNPEKQCYTLIEKYRQGQRDYSKIPYLVSILKNSFAHPLADTMTRDYFANYLAFLKDEDICQQDNLKFITENIEYLQSGQKMFSSFYRHGGVVDSVMKYKGLSQAVVDFIITREEISSRINTGAPITEINWTSIMQKIREKYGREYADRTVIDAKIGYYKMKRDWPNYTRNLIFKVQKYGVGHYLVDAHLNDQAYYVFMYSSNSNELNIALRWIDSAIALRGKPDPNKMDTKANILYKLGRTNEAMELERKAHELDGKNDTYLENLQKMESKMPTWNVDKL